MKRLTEILIVISMLVLVFSCGELVQYSENPVIEYKSHIAIDSTDGLGNPERFVKLKFSIIDGDGDFGLKDSDTIDPYIDNFYYNFFSTLYGKKNGDYKEVDISNPNYRIKYIEVEENKAYKADIIIDFEYMNEITSYDTVKYEFYVVDRALHQSNIASSPDIFF